MSIHCDGICYLLLLPCEVDELQFVCREMGAGAPRPFFNSRYIYFLDLLEVAPRARSGSPAEVVIDEC